MNPESLFSLSDHLERLSKDGDPLEVLEATVDFEYFRGWLVEGSAMAMGPRVVARHSIRCRCSRF
jgi:IS5 family transposase